MELPGALPRPLSINLLHQLCLRAGRRSLAWHLLLQAADRTLGDAEEQKFLGRLERLVAELGGELRKE